jgi:hypothetical protein
MQNGQMFFSRGMKELEDREAERGLTAKKERLSGPYCIQEMRTLPNRSNRSDEN